MSRELPGMCRELPGCSCCPSRRGKQPREKLLAQRFHVLQPQPGLCCPIIPYPAAQWSQRQENPEPKPWEEADGEHKGLARFSGPCSRQVRQQVAQHLMVEE